MKKNLTILMVFILVSLSFTITAKAAQNDETKVEVYVITDKNLTAYFNGSSTDGSVNYYIDGLEVLTEFENINTLIEQIQLLEAQNTDALSQDLQNKYNDLINRVDNVYGCVLDNLGRINQNNNSIENIKQELLNINNNLYMLRDELVAFEESYLRNISRIDGILDEINEKLLQHESLIQANQQNISELQDRFDDLYSNLANIGGIGSIFMAGFVGFYLFNKKYSFEKLFENGFTTKNGKQHRLLDFSKKHKSKTLKYKITHIKIDKNKSPLRFLFSFFQINK